MEHKLEDLTQKRIERALSKIGADVADAAALTEQSKALSARAETLLIAAQRGIEALYISFADD